MSRVAVLCLVFGLVFGCATTTSAPEEQEADQAAVEDRPVVATVALAKVLTAEEPGYATGQEAVFDGETLRLGPPLVVPLVEVEASTDGYGLPAVGIVFASSAVDDVQRWTGENVDSMVAFSSHGAVVWKANVEAPLGQNSVLRGRLTEEEVQGLIDAILQGHQR